MTDLDWTDLWRRASHDLALDAAVCLTYSQIEKATRLARMSLLADERRSDALLRHMTARVLIADGRGPVREETAQ
jgi:hypothetical protein